ncbi:MAG: mandelate racemase/muconate lactonizing enzyme family protein, partial [Cohnella sp.]|nr:mandelate racemase/muconate lactonizing enzyme family protein [Cohnella sp.]
GNVKFRGETDYYTHAKYKAIYSTKQESMIVKITTECGLIGWGEALSPIAPEVTGEIVRKILSPLLIGEDPRNVEVLWNTMYDSMRERGFLSGFMVTAIAAVDIALWDLWGKSLQLPVWRLLGGAARQQIHAYQSGFAAEDDQGKIRLALDWQAEGFNAIKIHLGYGLLRDAQVAQMIREAVGDDFRLMADVHQQYPVSQAIQLGRRLERLGFDFLEAPVPCEDINGIAEVSRALDMAVAIGEEIRTRYEFKERLLRRAGDIYQPDIGFTGITEMRKIATMSEAFHIPIAPHISNGLGICIAATLQLCANMNNFYILEFQPTVFAIANLILQEPLVCEAGYYQLPEGPGLGIEVNETKLAQHAIRL